MKKIKHWSDIPTLSEKAFLIINITHVDKNTRRYSEALYKKNAKYLSRNQSGDWKIGRGNTFEYVVLFFREFNAATSVYIGRKSGEPVQRADGRKVIHVDQWVRCGISESSFIEFCDGLKVPAHPVLVSRPILGKCIRICWNSGGWQSPRGEAASLESNSYVAEYKFGHEEWLFDWARILPLHNSGEYYKYGFLQPIGKYFEKYAGSTMDVLLYTLDPTGNRLVVARIKNLYVPLRAEVAQVVRHYRKAGWVGQMKRQLAQLGIRHREADPFEHDTSIVNVRFRQEDVEFYEPHLPVPSHSGAAKSNRYHPFDWDRAVPPAMPVSGGIGDDDDGDDELPSDAQRWRAAVNGTFVDLHHLKIQRALCRFLRKKYRPQAVERESDFVDIKLKLPSDITFFEIKTASTAKRCIREALGQLLEYGHYANENFAHRLIVVGDIAPTNNDHLYLSFLRKRYRLPIYFAQWRWDLMELTDPI